MDPLFSVFFFFFFKMHGILEGITGWWLEKGSKVGRCVWEAEEVDHRWFKDNLNLYQTLPD